MGTLEIGLIVGGSILALLIILIVFIRISNIKRFRRLQANLKKIKEEEQTESLDDKVILPKEEESAILNQDEQYITGNEMKVEDYIPDEQSEDNNIKPVVEDYVSESDKLPPYENYDQKRRFENKNKIQKVNRDKDFEDFLNEHAFSRKVFNKSLLDKIRELPPEVKAIVLGNVFDKFDDDKK